jgi:hypothetical protein
LFYLQRLFSRAAETSRWGASRWAAILVSAGQCRARQPRGWIGRGVPISGRSARKIPVRERQRCRWRDHSACNPRSGRRFPVLDIAGCPLTVPFLATSSMRGMIDMMRIMVMLVQMGCLCTATRGWAGLRRHSPRGWARFPLRLLQSGCWWSSRDRRWQRGARHRAVFTAG